MCACMIQPTVQSKSYQEVRVQFKRNTVEKQVTCSNPATKQ